MTVFLGHGDLRRANPGRPPVSRSGGCPKFVAAVKTRRRNGYARRTNRSWIAKPGRWTLAADVDIERRMRPRTGRQHHVLTDAAVVADGHCARFGELSTPADDFDTMRMEQTPAARYRAGRRRRPCTRPRRRVHPAEGRLNPQLRRPCGRCRRLRRRAVAPLVGMHPRCRRCLSSSTKTTGLPS